MAQGLPESEFVGIDLSASQIADGQAMVDAVELKNIRLNHLDILDVDAGFGQFDYIIAHGGYSWVPSQVQDKILEVCRQNLAPNGVAYVSYNTYPGWHLHGAIRDMMLYHTRQVAEPAEQIAQARELLDFLAESVLTKSNAYAGFLHSYVNYVKERFLPDGDDAYLFHNELAEVNEPVYFYQFAERAAGHGLRYLAEAQFQTMLAGNLPDKVSVSLRQMAKNTIALEQYMDFLRNRMFRQTLLCHQEVQLKSKLTPERLAKFYVASSALPKNPEIDIHSTSVDKFYAPNGDTLATDHPVTKAAMLYLTEVWPQAVAFNTLLLAAYSRLNGSGDSTPDFASPGFANDMQILGAGLLNAYSYNEDIVELHVHAPRFVREISERPVASPVARFQAKRNTRITNLRHELIQLEGLSHYLLSYLDGSWSRAALLKVLQNLLIEGTIEVEQDGKPLKAPADIKRALPEMLEAALRSLADAALLVG